MHQNLQSSHRLNKVQLLLTLDLQFEQKFYARTKQIIVVGNLAGDLETTAATVECAKTYGNIEFSITFEDH